MAHVEAAGLRGVNEIVMRRPVSRSHQLNWAAKFTGLEAQERRLAMKNYSSGVVERTI